MSIYTLSTFKFRHLNFSDGKKNLDDSRLESAPFGLKLNDLPTELQIDTLSTRSAI